MDNKNISKKQTDLKNRNHSKVSHNIPHRVTILNSNQTGRHVHVLRLNPLNQYPSVVTPVTDNKPLQPVLSFIEHNVTNSVTVSRSSSNVPLNSLSEVQSLTGIDHNKSVAFHEAYLSAHVGKSQTVYVERLSKGILCLLLLSDDKITLTAEKILYAVNYILDVIRVTRSGKVKSILDVKVIRKEQIQLLKTVITRFGPLFKSHSHEGITKIVMSHRAVFCSDKLSGFDITMKLLLAVICEIKRGKLDTINQHSDLPEIASAALSDSICQADLLSAKFDGSKPFDSIISSDDGNNAHVSSMKEVDFNEFYIELNGEEISLEEAIERLKGAIKNIKKFCPKTFVTEHLDVVIGILSLGVYDRALPFSIDDICSRIIDGSSSKATLGKLKKLFRNTYRRSQIEPNDTAFFNTLKSSITNSVLLLEPGEDIDCLWNETIASSFEELVTSQYKNICIKTRNREFQVTWLEKFLDQLFAKKGLWPQGMMTAEFLKNKAHEMLQIDIDMVDLPIIEKSPSKCRAGLPAGYYRNYKDLDRPSKDIKISDKKGGFDNLTKHWPRKDSDPLHTKNTQLLPNPTPSKSMQRSSRHRSDESQTDSHSHSHHKRSISPRRKKRHSNESCIRDRSVKRPRLEERFVVKEMTDYDKKLQSFKIWDPFRNVTEMAIKEVFQTKEGTPETIGPKIPSPSSSYLGHLTSETSASNTPGPSTEPQTEAAATSSMIDQIEDQNNTKETNENKEILDKSALSKGKEKLISKSADQQESEDSSKMKSEVLRDRYGDIDIKLEDTASDSVSVVITIQGYFFEGVAPTQNEALEDASCKALLLAPYILHKL